MKYLDASGYASGKVVWLFDIGQLIWLVYFLTSSNIKGIKQVSGSYIMDHAEGGLWATILDYSPFCDGPNNSTPKSYFFYPPSNFGLDIFDIFVYSVKQSW